MLIRYYNTLAEPDASNTTLNKIIENNGISDNGFVLIGGNKKPERVIKHEDVQRAFIEYVRTLPFPQAKGFNFEDSKIAYDKFSDEVGVIEGISRETFSEDFYDYLGVISKLEQYRLSKRDIKIEELCADLYNYLQGDIYIFYPSNVNDEVQRGTLKDLLKKYEYIVSSAEPSLYQEPREREHGLWE